MSTTTANQPRAAALKAARAKDSERKRRRALAALEALEASGASITFTAVAKAAGVSTWLVYAEGIREHIDAARHRQAHGAAPAPTPSAKCTTTSDSLRTDLALAQEQIKTLRAERDKLQQRLRLQLGAELEAPDRAHLTARVADLEAINRQLVAERDARTTEADTAKSRVGELEDELSAARESLRRVIKTQNRAP
jgi:flagellar biosynthesis chaperone FliJ